MDLLELINDPERRQAAAEEQTLRRERSGHRVLTDPALATYRWGVARVEMSVVLLDAALNEHAGRERQDEILDQIAEGHAAQGKFASAAALCNSPIPGAEYFAKARAISNLGNRCDCPETIKQAATVQVMYDGKQFVTLQRCYLTTIQVIYDGEQFITLKRCYQCGRISALKGRQE